jgi:hypothetical protein
MTIILGFPGFGSARYIATAALPDVLMALTQVV